MIPLHLLPGYTQWGQGLDELLDRPETLWVQGPSGSGVSTVGRHFAHRRGSAFLDEADSQEPASLESWIDRNPGGVLGSHTVPDGPIAYRCLHFALWPLSDDPAAVQGCLQALAAQEGLTGALPSALALLPCPENLLGLKNRLVRWKILGQLPGGEPPAGSALPLDDDNLAANLHLLERLLLHRALRRAYGNRMETAQRLGVSRRQLYLLIERHGDPVRGKASKGTEPLRLRKHRNSSPGSSGR